MLRFEGDVFLLGTAISALPQSSVQKNRRLSCAQLNVDPHVRIPAAAAGSSRTKAPYSGISGPRKRFTPGPKPDLRRTDWWPVHGQRWTLGRGPGRSGSHPPLATAVALWNPADSDDCPAENRSGRS